MGGAWSWHVLGAPHPNTPIEGHPMRGGTLTTIILVLVGIAALIFIVQAL